MLPDEDMKRHPRLGEKLNAIRQNAGDLIAKLDEKKLDLDDRRQRLVDARADFEDAAGKAGLVCDLLRAPSVPLCACTSRVCSALGLAAEETGCLEIHEGQAG